MLVVRNEPMQQPAFLNLVLLISLFLTLLPNPNLFPDLNLLPNPHFHRGVIAGKPLQTHRATTLPTTSSSNSPSRTFRTFHLVHPLLQSITFSVQVGRRKQSLLELLPPARPHQTLTFHPKAFNVKTLKNRKSLKNSNERLRNRESWIQM